MELMIRTVIGGRLLRFRKIWLLLLLTALVSICNTPTRAAPLQDLVTRLPGQPIVEFKQYAGHVTVDQRKGRAFFYYFVEAADDPERKPLALWLNGGPGCSSVAGGGFTELGPFYPNGYANGLVRNSHSWNRVANLLFLESPVGVGWSYSNTSSDYISATDESTAQDNLEFLFNWFDKFPEYKSHEFYLTGESYAGHYIPQLAALVSEYNKNPTRDFVFNLKGIQIGNPLLRYGVDTAATYTFLWSHGLISQKTFRGIRKTCDFRQYALTGEISDSCDNFISTTYSEEGAYINGYDVLLDVCLPGVAEQELRLHKKLTHRSLGVDVCIDNEMEAYLNLPEVQEALHANTTKLDYDYQQCSEVLKYSLSNYSIDILPVLSDLLQKSHVKILIYSGDADQVVPFIGTRINADTIAKRLHLETTVNYTAWYHDRQVAGWTKTTGNLTYATVRGAAHMVPYSQPARALTLFTSFITGTPLTSFR
ncbi:unnamed protein product [Calypogeia fissa]